MAWSTRQVADLAGTTLRAVRHYHEVGLLPEPERRANGYKRYGVTHLVRVLRIKRLTDLGFSLSQIAAMGDTDRHPEEAMRTLDAELSRTIERLQRVRVELAVILRDSVPIDLPPELAPAGRAGLSAADRSLMVVLAQVVGPGRLQSLVDLVEVVPVEISGREFDDLPADADEPTRRDLAVRMAEGARELREQIPELPDLAAPGSGSGARTLDVAMAELYNPAQVDVIRRMRSLRREPPGSA